MDYRDSTVSSQQYLCQHHHERSLFFRVCFVRLNLTNEVSFLKNISQAAWKHGPTMQDRATTAFHLPRSLPGGWHGYNLKRHDYCQVFP